MENKIGFRLLVISDRKLCRHKSLEEITREAFSSGVKAFQLREKDLSALALLTLARNIKKISIKSHAKLIINERLDIALLANAEGVHSPEKSINPQDVKKFGKNLIIGKSVHSVESAIKAERDGYDYILFGPVFRTKSKIKYGRPKGIAELKKVCCTVKIPVFALGGINPERAIKCINAGAHGAAVIGAIFKSKNVKRTVLEFKKSLGGL
jgi:thiamine-phosphate pyrophosphorylase